MIAAISMLEVLGYFALVAFLGFVVYFVTSCGLAVYEALLVIRRYYRENPAAQPPDKFLVRLGLRGVR